MFDGELRRRLSCGELSDDLQTQLFARDRALRGGPCDGCPADAPMSDRPTQLLETPPNPPEDPVDPPLEERRDPGSSFTHLQSLRCPNDPPWRGEAPWGGNGPMTLPVCLNILIASEPEGSRSPS